MKGLVQNQLKNQSLGTVKPVAFKQVGGVIFPDQTANMDMAKLSAIVEAFQSVHSPNYGQPIPQSSEIYSVVGNESLITLAGNEVALVNAISCTNGGGAPITAQIKVASMILAVVVIDPTSTIAMNSNANNIGSFYLDSLNTLSINVTEGNASDLTTTALTMRVCQ